jgi:hypothetical protein
VAQIAMGTTNGGGWDWDEAGQATTNVPFMSGWMSQWK